MEIFGWIIKPFSLNHGYIITPDGVKRRQKMLWIMKAVMHIDSFFCKWGRESIPNTLTLIGRSGNVRGPSVKHQPIFIGFYDYDRTLKCGEPVLIWGSDLTVESAKKIVEELNKQIDYFEAFQRPGGTPSAS